MAGEREARAAAKADCPVSGMTAGVGLIEGMGLLRHGAK